MLVWAFGGLRIEETHGKALAVLWMAEDEEEGRNEMNRGILYYIQLCCSPFLLGRDTQ